MAINPNIALSVKGTTLNPLQQLSGLAQWQNTQSIVQHRQAEMQQAETKRQALQAASLFHQSGQPERAFSTLLAVDPGQAHQYGTSYQAAQKHKEETIINDAAYINSLPESQRETEYNRRFAQRTNEGIFNQMTAQQWGRWDPQRTPQMLQAIIRATSAKDVAKAEALVPSEVSKATKIAEAKQPLELEQIKTRVREEARTRGYAVPEGGALYFPGVSMFGDPAKPATFAQPPIQAEEPRPNLELSPQTPDVGPTSRVTPAPLAAPSGDPKTTARMPVGAPPPTLQPVVQRPPAAKTPLGQLLLERDRKAAELGADHPDVKAFDDRISREVKGNDGAPSTLGKLISERVDLVQRYGPNSDMVKQYDQRIAKEIGPTPGQPTQLAKAYSERNELAATHGVNSPIVKTYDKFIDRLAAGSGQMFSVGPDGTVTFGQGTTQALQQAGQLATNSARDETLSAVKFGEHMLTVIDGSIKAATENPTRVGFIGDVRRTIQRYVGLGQDIGSVIPGAKNIINFGRAAATQAISDKNSDPSVVQSLQADFYDPELDNLKLLENSLAMALAKTRQDRGRLLADVYKDAKKDVDIGGLTSSREVINRLAKLRQMLNDQVGVLNKQIKAQTPSTRVFNWNPNTNDIEPAE